MAVELATTPPQLNQWGTISFEIPDFLENTRDKINDVAEILIAALDIVLTALEFVKTFLVGYLDPISALLDAILSEINALINDLRQLGIYITGDWKLLKWPFDEVLGGYQEYERRMVARLTDLTDPTRPDVSAATEVLSLFFYLSADATSVERLVVFVDQLVGFFHQSFTRSGSLPTASISNIKYGADAVDLIHPKSLVEAFKASATPPSVAKVKWSLASTAQKSPYNPLPPLPPGGFLITVSTLPDGLKVVYDCPQSDATTSSSTVDPSINVQPREYGQVRIQDSGAPLILHGGASMIPSSNLLIGGTDTVAYNYPEAGDKGRARIYAQKVVGDDGILPLEELQQGENIFLYQRTFYVPNSEKWAAWAEGEYGFILSAEDMPYTCKWETQSNGTIKPVQLERATTAYVRVASCSARAVENGVTYQFLSPLAKGGRTFVDSSFAKGLGSQDVGAWSAPMRVTFPSANTQTYLEALKVALLVLILSRPDLTLLDKDRLTPGEAQKLAKGTLMRPGEVLAQCGLEGMRHLAGIVFDDYRKAIESKSDPVAFRKQLLDAIDRVAHNIYNTTGANPQVEKIVAEQTKFLRTATWGDVFGGAHPELKDKLPFSLRKATLLQSLDPSTEAGRDFSNGIGANPYSLGVEEDVVREWDYVPNLIRDRDPHMIEAITSSTTDTGFTADLVVPADKVSETMAKSPPGMQRIYEKFKQDDGSIVIPPDMKPMLTTLVTRQRREGSADRSPVVYLNRNELRLYTSSSSFNPQKGSGVFYCRGLFAKAQGGQLFHEASVALSLAAAAITRSKQDGGWVALRFFDLYPTLDDFFSSLKNWLESLQKSIKSIVDTITKYIEFIEARIIELQQLIRRINQILQELTGFVFQIPQCSALVLVSKGTQGVLGDLVNSKNKPSDSPLAYGAGIAVVIPFGPSLAMDVVRALFVAKEGSPASGKTLAGTGQVTPAVGIEGLPSPEAPAEDAAPDVL